MELIDTHCHLPSLEISVDEVIANAGKVHVKRFVCIGASSGIESVKQSISLAERYSQIYASVGIHPHDAGDYPSIDPVVSGLSHPRVVAIGETGLDFFRDWAPKDAQYALFRSTIAAALKIQKPLIIHCRDAEEETFRVLEEEGAKEVGGVFHCYAGNAAYAAELEKLNFIVSFTGNITFKKAQALREAVRDIPLNRIMLETDCPYMAPEPFRGKPSEPMHVFRIANEVADVKGISLEEVAKVTTENAEKLFQLKKIETFGI